MRRRIDVLELEKREGALQRQLDQLRGQQREAALRAAMERKFLDERLEREAVQRMCSALEQKLERASLQQQISDLRWDLTQVMVAPQRVAAAATADVGVVPAIHRPMALHQSGSQQREAQLQKQRCSTIGWWTPIGSPRPSRRNQRPQRLPQ